MSLFALASNPLRAACTSRLFFGLQMDALTAFGLFAVTAMVTFYALEDRNRFYVLGFAGGCVLGSIYGFLQGAWPFGVVEAIWSLIALRRFWRGNANR